MYIKIWRGQQGLKGPMEQGKGIVQKYTASVQQIGRTLRDKGEKEWKEVGARANNNTYLKCTKPNNTITSTQTSTTQILKKYTPENYI